MELDENKTTCSALSAAKWLRDGFEETLFCFSYFHHVISKCRECREHNHAVVQSRDLRHAQTTDNYRFRLPAYETIFLNANYALTESRHLRDKWIMELRLESNM